MSREASPIFVVKQEDTRHHLVAALTNENKIAVVGTGLAVDVMWTVDGIPCMWDLKTIDDFIASYGDGRIFEQITSMQEAGCELYGFVLHGSPSHDGGYTCGTAPHAWGWDAFENAVLRVEAAGAKVTRCPTDSRLAKRIASIYDKTTDDDGVGSWANPVPIIPASDFKSGPVFINKTFRSQVGMIMHLPGWGPKLANEAREKYSLMEVLGITEEGLAIAKNLWSTVPRVGPKIVRASEEYLRS